MYEQNLDTNRSNNYNIDIVSKKKNKKKTKFNYYCGNCGKYGHIYRNCHEPITSFGIILIKFDYEESFLRNGFKKRFLLEEDFDDSEESSDEKISISIEGINFRSDRDIEIFCHYKNLIKFLLIRRKHTLGYIEFVRGRYSVENMDGIIFLFRQMTSDEIKRIGCSSFDELWNELWSNNKNKSNYHNEYMVSKQKFEKLKTENETYLNLEFYVENVEPNWNYAEWGFPKGRRNFQESNRACAVREFGEESGFIEDDYILLDRIFPFEERFIGTNGITYKHIYYPAIASSEKIPSIDPNNKNQIDEIGAIGWFTYEEAINLLRPYHTERKKVLTELFMYVMDNIVDLWNSKSENT